MLKHTLSASSLTFAMFEYTGRQEYRRKQVGGIEDKDHNLLSVGPPHLAEYLSYSRCSRYVTCR